MKRNWSEPELEEFWTLSPDELKLAFGLAPTRQLGLALQLKFLQIEGHFPGSRRDFPALAVRHVSEQIGVHQKHFAGYDIEGRTAQRDRVSIRKISGYRESNETDKKRLVTWLCNDILPRGPDPQQLDDLAVGWLKEQQVEAPDATIRQRLIRTAIVRAEDQLCVTIISRLSDNTKHSIDELLEGDGGTEPTARPRSSRPSAGSVVARFSTVWSSC